MFEHSGRRYAASSVVALGTLNVDMREGGVVDIAQEQRPRLIVP